MSLKEIFEILAYSAAVGAAVASWWQYRQNSARDRTKWLYELYGRFYEQTSLRQMRIQIDEHATEFIEKGETRSFLLISIIS
jgi:hypothetical protein